MTVKKLVSLLLVIALCMSVMFAFSACRSGEKRTCDKCGGVGYYATQFAYKECSKCKGKGHVFE